MVEAWIASIVAGLSITAAWLDLRSKMNGNGPISRRLESLEDRFDHLDHRLDRIESIVRTDARRTRPERNA